MMTLEQTETLPDTLTIAGQVLRRQPMGRPYWLSADGHAAVGRSSDDTHWYYSSDVGGAYVVARADTLDALPAEAERVLGEARRAFLALEPKPAAKPASLVFLSAANVARLVGEDWLADVLMAAARRHAGSEPGPQSPIETALREAAEQHAPRVDSDRSPRGASVFPGASS